VKIWGKPNERIRRCWQAYTKDVDSIVGIFLSASIFCELVEIFVAKKNEKYFTRFNSISEYMADKKEKKQTTVTRKADKSQNPQQQHLNKLKQQRENRAESRHKVPVQPAPKYVHQDSLGDYRIKKRGAVNKEPTETESQSKNGGGKESRRIRKLNIESDESDSEAKLNEITNVRRSTRSTRLTRRSEMAEESEVKNILRESF